jgi:hypothetical protein
MNRGLLCVGGPAHGMRYPGRGTVLVVPIAVDTGHGWGPFIIEARYDLVELGRRRAFWRWPTGEPTDRSPTR